MTTLTTHAPRVIRNLQARSTASILNIVRYLGTGAFALLALLTVIVTLVSISQPNTSWTSLILGAVGFGFAIVSGALFYAVVGWFVDTLSLLTRIAKVQSA